MTPARPLILFVPGLLPKPAAEEHKALLWRCLLTGLERSDPAVADVMRPHADCLRVIAWTYDFYGVHRDFQLDAPSVDALIAKSAASAEDIAEATSWKRRMTRWLYLLGDWLPFSIAALGGKRLASHLRDLKRYEQNSDGLADQARDKLKNTLCDAQLAGRPVLLIGHSMGSIIAYDVLWEMSAAERGSKLVDLLLTMGSPLGQRFLQHRLKGRDKHGAERYPDTIREWVNLAAVGDLTALDRSVADDFSEMVSLGLIETITDESVSTYFRLDGELNVHTEYGYMVAEKTAHTIAQWWRRHDHSFSESN